MRNFVMGWHCVGIYEREGCGNACFTGSVGIGGGGRR